jgi:hypothetical protein
MKTGGKKENCGVGFFPGIGRQEIRLIGVGIF